MAYIANFTVFDLKQESYFLANVSNNEFLSLGLQSFSCEGIAIAILKNKTLQNSII